MGKISKGSVGKVAVLTVVATLLGNNISLDVVNGSKVALAAKNHDGVCQVETKTGELVFQATGKNITTTKPLDLLVVVDSSGSMLAKDVENMVTILRGLLSSLDDNSRVMIASYTENTATSYTDKTTRILTKAEAISVFDAVKNSKNTPDAVYRYDDVWKAAKSFSDTQYGRPFEDAFEKTLDPKHTHSIIQVTDGWLDHETIDTSFVQWATKNAKTFMSVLLGSNSSSRSYTEMVAAGHSNIYMVPYNDPLDLAAVTNNVVSQFKDTATERINPQAAINVTPEQGITLKEVKLVAPDGKEEVLPIQGNKVNVTKELGKDGNYKVKVKADGLVPENRKVTTTVNIANKEVGKSEILFEGCKDDVKGTDEERTKVNIDFKTKYVDDANLMTGTEKVVTDGVTGIKEIIKTWNTINGKRVGEPKIVENMLQGVIDKVIARGTKGFDREVIKQKILFDTKYIDDEKLESGKTKVVTDGVEGEKEITKVYVTQSGKRVGEPTVTEKVVKPKVDKVIARGTQQPKDFTYRVLDKDGKVLVDTTKVVQGYIGNEYKLAEVPKLDGYEVVTPDGIKLDGVFNGENVNIDFVAYKLGKGVTLKTVTKDDKEVQAEQSLIEDNKRIGTEYSVKVAYEIKDKGKLYRLVALEKDGKPVDMKLDKDIDLKGSVSDVKSEYKAVYEEVKVGDVKVEFVDDTGKTLKSSVLLNTKDSLLGADYKYDVEARLKVGEDTYALTKTTLDDKEVKDIKGQFEEKAKTYKLVYKKVVKPEPKKLPKTSGDTSGSFGLVSTIVGLGLLLLGFVRKLVLK